MASVGGLCESARRVQTDRGLRDHRGPADDRAGGHRRLARLPLLPALRLAVDLRRDAGTRERRDVPDRHRPGARPPQAALPARHERPHDPLPLARGRGRGHRLHAGRRDAAHARGRPAREGGARPVHVPGPLPTGLQLREGLPPDREGGRGAPVRAGRRGEPDAAPAHAGGARRRRRRRRRRGHARFGRDGRLHPGGRLRADGGCLRPAGVGRQRRTTTR